MNAPCHSSDPGPASSGRDFYVTGGTLRPDAPSYVERQADKDLYQGLIQGEFCYVLTSRQMGKSSLMVRTVKRLRQEGVAVAVLDLTAIGQNLTIEQWYDGLSARLGQQLKLEDEFLAFGEAHPEWGPLQRWITAIEMVVLKHITSRVVIFVDEIDIVRSVPFSTDEFFAAIREFYNRRSRERDFSRLAFGLLGVATPTDLIRDTRMTPFNIGRRIELNDFSVAEAAPLARGLGADERTAQALLSRILYWTGGHPYLTQRLCRTMAETIYQPTPDGPDSKLLAPPIIPTERDVDQLAEKLFLSRQARDRDDNLIFVRERILRSETDVAGLLYLYRKILTGQPVPDDETDPQVCILRLSGITRNTYGCLQVRNRIYFQVFDLSWIQTNMPHAEVRRQRKAGRRGVIKGLVLAVVLLLLYLIAGPRISHYRHARFASRTIQNVLADYRRLNFYQDSFDASVEIGLGSTMVPVTGSGSIVYEKPDKVELTLKSALQSPAIEIRLMSDGRFTRVFAPELKEHVNLGPGSPQNFLILPPPLAQQLGPIRMLPLYRMFLGEPAIDRFLTDAQNIRYGGIARLDDQRTYILQWDHSAEAFLGPFGLTNLTSSPPHIPVTAWVDSTSGVIAQIKMDLSHWASQLVSDSSQIPITSLVITETHHKIETSNLPVPAGRFRFRPPGPMPPPVEKFNLPPPNYLRLASDQRSFRKLIPDRISQTPANLIDLTDYYNAALPQSWHPGVPGNTLEALPTGLLQFSGVLFDVRGIVQLAGLQLQSAGGRYPPKIIGIKVNQTCRQLHFLQAAGWQTSEGTQIGTYVLHYADSQLQQIPLIYGDNIYNWHGQNSHTIRLKNAKMVWGTINGSGTFVHLFMMTWKNPWPEVPIVSMDYVSSMADAAPFLIAVTTEP